MQDFSVAPLLTEEGVHIPFGEKEAVLARVVTSSFPTKGPLRCSVGHLRGWKHFRSPDGVEESKACHPGPWVRAQSLSFPFPPARVGPGRRFARASLPGTALNNGPSLPKAAQVSFWTLPPARPPKARANTGKTVLVAGNPWDVFSR